MDNVVLKRCTKCNIVKPLSEFYRNKYHTGGFQSFCKACLCHSIKIYRQTFSDKCKEWYRKWAVKNSGKIKSAYIRWNNRHPNRKKELGKIWRNKYPKKIKEWRIQHLEQIKETNKKWRMEHPGKVSEYARRHRQKYPQKIRELQKRWKEKNPERAREPARKWRIKNKKYFLNYGRKRRKTIRGNLDSRMSANLYAALRKNKSGRTWQSLVGYTIADLKIHLESLFTDGMSWDNMGKWHIDHVIPKSRFHYEKPENVEFKICWGLSNLQPMWGSDNLSKGSRTMEEWNNYKKKKELS